MGVPKIEVAFNIDANGILNVTARDQGTGKEQTIHIQSSGGLDKDEIERMKRDAESHAAEDKKRRELAEARNTAEQRVYQLEKLIEEHKDKLSESDQSALQRGDRQGQRSQEARRRGGDQPCARRAPARQPGDGRASLRRRQDRPGPAGPARRPAAALQRRPGGKPEDVIDVEFEEKK